MFTKEGKNILNAIGGFLTEAAFAIIMVGMLIAFGVGLTIARDETLMVILGYTSIAVGGYLMIGALQMLYEEMISDIKRELNKIKETEEENLINE